MLLKDYTESNTRGIAGLSNQLCNKAVGLGFLVHVAHPNLITDSNSLVHLYLQPRSAAALLRVAARCKVQISTAYRTLAQQYVLKHNLTTLVAPIGRSDHGSGRSVDVVNYSDIIGILRDEGWQETYASDLVHFDYPGTDQRSNTILTFQHLWNDHNFNDRLDLDGVCGPHTLECLANSPISGW